MLYKSLDKKEELLMGFEEIVKSLPQEQQDVVNAELEKVKGSASEDAKKKIADDLKAALANPVEKAESEDELVSEVAKAIVEATKVVEVQKATDDTEEILKSMPESIRKAYEDMQKREAESIKLAKALADEKITKEFQEKAAFYKSIPSTKEELGAILKSVSADTEVVAKLEAILTATDKMLSDAGLFKSVGSANSANMETDAISQLNKKADDIKKSVPALSEAQAFTQAMRENPDLYKQYTKELLDSEE